MQQGFLEGTFRINEAGQSVETFGNSFLSDLLESIEEQEVQELELEKMEQEGFQITSPEQANYFVKKLKAVRTQQAEAAATAQAEIDKHAQKVQNWLDKTLSPLNSQEAFFLAILEDYAKRSLAESNKKSLKMIDGTLSIRKQLDKFEYDDTALVTALEADETLKATYVSYEPSPMKAELKKDGQVVNGKLVVQGKEISGVTVTPQPDKFEVK